MRGGYGGGGRCGRTAPGTTPELISQAIESAPEKRLTLARIYEWMVRSVPYFKDKGDSNSSAGWKLSYSTVQLGEMQPFQTTRVKPLNSGRIGVFKEGVCCS